MNIKKLLTLTLLVAGLTNLAINCGPEGRETKTGRHGQGHHEHPGHHGPHDGHGRHHMHDHPMVKYHLEDGNRQAGKLDVYNQDTKAWDVYTLSSETSSITEKPVKREHKEHERRHEEGKHHEYKHRHEGKEGKIEHKEHKESTKPHHHHVKARKDAQGNIVLDVYENDKWVVYKK
jgi:hypothetical protein